MLFAELLRKFVRHGHLTMIDARGRRHEFGESGDGSDHVTIRLHDPSLHWKLALNPRLYVGEAYMDGTLTVEDGGDIFDFLDLVGRNGAHEPVSGLDRMLMAIRYHARRLSQANPITRARQNVAHHYDLSDTLYDLFLDPRRQYSCAYFARPDLTLEEAQLAKLNHIAAKLRLEPGQKVLDIGCGWGGMAMHLAETADVEVTGITLSTEQLNYARAEAERRGLADRVSFELRDYRDEQGTYDRIVSVGMFEHVGVPNYDTFFRSVRNLLAEDGIALLHSIVQMNPPQPTNPWLVKYIFPGGYCPAPSEVIASVERSALWITDMETLRLHYAETLRNWRKAFHAHWHEAAALYDERFCRMWDFYLAGSELGFRHGGHMVAQIQLTRQQDAVPLTRNYMYERQAEEQAAESYRPRRVA